MVELVRDQAPPRPVSELPPGPQQVEAAASRPVPRELEKVRITEAQDQVEPLLIPERTPQPESAVQATAGSRHNGAVVTTRAPCGASASSASSDWRGRLLAHLESNKRYPAAALARRQQGVAHVRFVMDRQGPRPDQRGSIAARARPVLDHAALDMLTLCSTPCQDLRPRSRANGSNWSCRSSSSSGETDEAVCFWAGRAARPIPCGGSEAKPEPPVRWATCWAVLQVRSTIR